MTGSADRDDDETFRCRVCRKWRFLRSLARECEAKHAKETT